MNLTAKMLLVFLVLLIATLRSDAQEISVTSKHDSYIRCPTTDNTIGQGSDVIAARSEFQCVARCSQSENCSGVTVCPGGESDTVTCEMRNDTSLGQCLPYPAQCHLITRMLQTTTELTCENGGTPNSNKCFCPLPFAGRRCQRYMRDCSEGYENGHEDGHYGVYLIQPMTSPAPFLVKCAFAWGGVTYPLLRLVSGTSWSGVTWEQAKEGLGDDLTIQPDSNNFFIGLEKLHQILSQGLNTNQIQFKYGDSGNKGSAFYRNFTVSSKPTQYQLSYDSFYDYADNPSLNGLDVGSGPVVFAAPGNDPNGCAGSRGAPGWYGSDCSGHSMFADPPTWPVPGQGSPELKHVSFVLVRKEPFLEE